MKALKLPAVGRLIAISVAILICIANFAYAQGYRGGKVGTVILVHGAWADGSSWKEVIPRLEARGINVVAVQLPLSSLANDVATVQRAIAIAPSPVILVGHSYGGAVITEAGNDPNVIGLVYVAAFAPDAGESTMTLNALYPPSPVRSMIREHLTEHFNTWSRTFEECIREAQQQNEILGFNIARFVGKFYFQQLARSTLENAS